MSDKIVMIRFENLTFPAWYVRGKSVDRENVERIKDKLQADNEQARSIVYNLPPLLTRPLPLVEGAKIDEQRYEIVDGVSRATAIGELRDEYRRRDKTVVAWPELPAHVVTIDDAEAIKAQGLTNLSHGLPLHAWQRDAWILAYANAKNVKLSDRGEAVKLAKELGLSEATVSRAKRGLKGAERRSTGTGKGKKAAKKKGKKAGKDERHPASKLDPKEYFELLIDARALWSEQAGKVICPWIKKHPKYAAKAAHQCAELAELIKTNVAPYLK